MHTKLDAGEYAVVADFDADAFHVTAALQMIQQRTVATTQVEHATAGRDPLGDAREILADALPYPARGHG